MKETLICKDCNTYEKEIKIIAGLFVFISALLGFLHSKYWLIFTMFVGLNLAQYAISGFCPLNNIIRKVKKND